MKVTVARLLYVLIGITLVIIFTGCKKEAAESTSVSVPTENPVSPSQPPAYNHPNNTSPSQSTNMPYNVAWDNSYNAEEVSISLHSYANNNINYKRIDIYSDSSCLKLVAIATPASLLTTPVAWSVQRGVTSFVSVVETDINDVASPCRNISSTEISTDIIAPSAPSNLQVNYSWSNATTLSFRTEWTAATDNVSVVRYYLYLSTDPNSYANPLVSTSTTGISRNFSFTITDPNMFMGSSVFIHILAEDQNGNLSQALTDSGYYIDTTAPSLGVNVAYLDRGSLGIALNISGTCVVGVPVDFSYSSNMSSFSSLLVHHTSCNNGVFTYTFPLLYVWYADNMEITASQTHSNSTTTSFPVQLVSSASLLLVI